MAKSPVARGASMAANVWSKLDLAVKAKGGTEDALHNLDKDDGAPLVDVIADILVKAELKTRNRFSITVDYSKSLDQMVAAGNYNYANPNIVAANFPITGTGVVEKELILVHFDRFIESDDAVRELNEMGLEPAGIAHATAFGAKYPDVQREYPVVFLGSGWVGPRGNRCVPCLDEDSRERSLYLDDWLEWYAHYRFAAVRKVKKALGHLGS